MGLPIKTSTTILTALRQGMVDLNSLINWADHSVAWDISLKPASEIGADLWMLADFVTRVRSLNGISEIINDSSYKESLRVLFEYDTITQVEDLISSLLDDLVGNWGVTRRSAQTARVPVRFYAASNAAVTLDSGLRVSTRGTTPQYYQTLTGVTGATPAYEAAKALYYVELMCGAETGGSAGNVAADRVTVLVDSFDGIIQCSNPIASFDGADAESDASLIARAQIKWQAWSINTRGGLEAFFKAQPTVDDAYVAGPNDPLLTRTSDKSPVDIFISAPTRAVQETDSLPMSTGFMQDRIQRKLDPSGEALPIVWPPTTGATFRYYLTKNPVISVDQVSGTTSGTMTFTESLDTDSDVTGSTRGRSYVEIAISGTSVLTETVQVTYTYDATILSLQNTINSPDYDLLTSDPLVRRGQSVGIDITVEITVFTGDDYPSASAVKKTVEADLLKMFAGGTTSAGRVFSAYQLGQRVDKSDIQLVIAEVTGVDRIVQLQTSLRGTEFTVSVTPRNSEYARIGTISWL